MVRFSDLDIILLGDYIIYALFVSENNMTQMRDLAGI